MKKIYTKIVCDDGKTISERKSSKNADCSYITRACRKNPTRPAVEVNNRRRRNATYAHLLNRNFDGGDTAVVLSISDDFYASVTDNIWAYIDRFVDRLEYRARKHGEKPKITIIVGLSKVGRIHAHALISKNIKPEWIISAWRYGYVFNQESFLTDGSFHALANYFMNNADRYKNSSRRSAYKNIGMCSVPTIKEEITEEEMFSSSCYDGYRKNHSQCYYGINDYGNAYSHSLYVKVDSQETNDITFAKTAGQDTGYSDGYIDGYNSYFNGAESADAYLSMQNRLSLGCNVFDSTIAEIQAYSDGYISTYCGSFEKGKYDAFIAKIKADSASGWSQLYFTRENGNRFFLSEEYTYLYRHSTLYYYVNGLWYPIGIGRLYSTKDGYITHLLPNGQYYTLCGTNYVHRQSYSKLISYGTVCHSA